MRGRIWATRKPAKLAWAVFVQATVVGPLLRGLAEFLKMRDPAWLLHPYFSFRVVQIYSWEMVKRWLSPRAQSEGDACASS